ncbi:MAG: sensor histidine kinase [Bacteroidales bacterium]
MRKYLPKLLNPYILALFPAIVIILSLPDYFSKYKIERIAHRIFDKGASIAYYDLNADGNSEMLMVKTYNDHDISFVVVKSSKLSIINEWDFHGQIIDTRNAFMTGDYNRNNLLEVYLFTRYHDSLFVGFCEPFLDTALIIRQKYLARIAGPPEKFAAAVLSGGFNDLNRDGYDEIYFSVSTGFNLQPRSIYAWDIKNDSIYSSPLMGASPQALKMEDLTGDGNKEVLVDCYAPGNYPKGIIPLEDSSCWSLVFTPDLKFHFPPKEYPGRTGSLQLLTVSDAGKKSIVAFYHLRDTVTHKHILQSIDIQGNILREKEIPEEMLDINKWGVSIVQGTGSNVLLFTNNTGYYTVDKNLNIVSHIEAPSISPGLVKSVDLDLDDQPECIVLGINSDQQYILDDDLAHATEFPLRLLSNKLVFSVRHQKGSYPTFTIMDGEDFWEYKYYKDPIYYAKYPIYLGIYALMVLFIWVIQLIGKIQIKRRLYIDNKIASLQMLAIQKQFDPHFTLNSLNSVIESIRTKKQEDAIQFIYRFTVMLRQTVETGDKIVRTLKQEISITENYLEIEKIRFNGRFECSLVISEQVDTSMFVPKMCILTYVENAVKHGVNPLINQSLIQIEIDKFDNYIVISISDNGPGLLTKTAKPYNGKGLSIMEQSYILFNSINKNKISWEIVDLKTPGSSQTGTRVIVRIPENLNYAIL